MGLHYYCHSCYGIVTSREGPCPHCGGRIERPAGTTYADGLVWALGHPVPDVAMTAAQVLGARGEIRAVEKLKEVARDSTDPYLAGQAVRSLVAILGRDAISDFLSEIAASGRLIPSRAASDALADPRSEQRSARTTTRAEIGSHRLIGSGGTPTRQ
jgi:hypothetical protein